MSHRAQIRNWIDHERRCCVECERHGIIYAQCSQYGQYYHSFTYWDQLRRAFLPKLPCHHNKQCTVIFVFCHEHNRVAQTTITTNNSCAVVINNRDVATPPTPDEVVDNAVPSSATITNANDISTSIFTTTMSDSQMRLTEMFNKLIDLIYDQWKHVAFSLPSHFSLLTYRPQQYV